MADEENDAASMAECGACRAVIPIDSTECPECGTNFSGLSDEALGECGACNSLVPLDSTQCPECGVLFVADDVVDILRKWVADTGINIRKLFDKFDDNSDGTIDSDELRAGLLSLNLADLPPSQVDRLVSEIDADGNGLIDLDEFDQILMGDEAPPAADDSENDGDDTASVVSTEPEAEEEPDDVPDEEEAASESVVLEDLSDADVHEDVDDVSDEDEHDIEDEAFEIDEDEEVDLTDEESTEETSDEGDAPNAHHPLSALSTLADLMDDHDISAQRLFNELDADGNGMISLAELRNELAERYGETLDGDEVDAIMRSIDVDGDDMIDVTEFIASMEDYETIEELVEEKVFPSPWQKRMMSKTWNDSVWPILHVGFGILVAIFIANGMFGFVDGSGGNIAYEPNDSGLIPSGNIAEGEIYPCDEKFQKDGCRNSLTPLAGDNGSLSMPTGFYWDGILFILISVIGLGATLFLHLVKAPEWRARAKAMKEFEQDKSEAAVDADNEDGSDDEEESVDDDEGESTDEAADDDDAYDDEDSEEEYADEDEEDEQDDDDEIDIGSHIGLVFDDEEVFGTIVEFDDDEGTVTIEEDGTGDLVTGYQEDMFVE